MVAGNFTRPWRRWPPGRRQRPAAPPPPCSAWEYASGARPACAASSTMLWSSAPGRRSTWPGVGVGRPRAWRRVAAAGAAPAIRAAAAPTRIISRLAPECIQAGRKALYWRDSAQSTSCLHVRGCADGQQGPGRRGGRPRRAGAQCSTLASLAPRSAALLAASSSAVLAARAESSGLGIVVGHARRP